MSVYGTLITTTTVRARSSRPAAHIATEEINGGIRTACGLFFREGKHQPSPEDRAPCGKCASHLAEAPDRKRFTRGAYATTSGLKRY